MTAAENKELCRTLTRHAQKYPRMQPCDAVKLLYQGEFGGDHQLKDGGQAFLTRLREECAGTARDLSAPLTEDIGEGWLRVFLPALDTEAFPPETLARAFVLSAQTRTGNQERFLQKLDTLCALTREGLFAFTAGELEDFLRPYIADGCPPVSHSPTYREAYHPAYRILRREYLPDPLPELPLPAEPPVKAVLEALRRLRESRGQVLVALDGRCAAGKTTLAARLRELCGCDVIHMDHFFLRPEQRSPARYETPGGNIDHERFLEEVLLPLSRSQPALYHPFDCGTQDFGPPLRVPPGPFLLMEGSYACHPTLRDFYDLHIFLDIDPEMQKQRILTRNIPAVAERFFSEWIPLEERYFSALEIRGHCQLVLSGE